MFALIKNQSSTFARWLNLLLVVFILYGTTVESAHRHGRILLSPAGATSQIDNEQTKNLASNRSGCNDCLICQLHQSFTTTLIALRLSDPPAQLPQRVITVVPRDLLSHIVSPLAGRAPPFVS
ncbi:MAG TPA: hypothetical protein VFO72_09385 [Pyrinomonadaceae bacterium]|nr:hypothetical protein [Pyrinomonadaceae bacterium]